MCCYAFFTQTLKEELMDKINEFLQEDEIIYTCEVTLLNSTLPKTFKMSYKLSCPCDL